MKTQSTTNGLDASRLPPCNLEAERSVLGSILLENDVLHDVVPFLRASDFYRDAHQVIYAAIRDLYDKGKGIDAVTLAEELKQRDQFEQVGGHDILTEIVESVPHAANGRYYAAIVKEKATNRQLIESAMEIIRDGYSNQFTAQELLESAERKVFQISEDHVRGDTLQINEMLNDAMERISRRAASVHAVSGVASGFIDLDEITWGFRPGQLIIVAARPSMGKTALTLNMCDHVAVNLRLPVLFVSLEMEHLEIVERLLSARARVDSHRLTTGMGLQYPQMKELSRAYSETAGGGPIFIDDTPTRTILQITAGARRLRMRKEIGLVVVDYIQLIKAHANYPNRYERMAEISSQLKGLARELKLPVIAVSQLSRSSEGREDRRPRMSDLRDSGTIEDDADVVLLLHRPEYYNANDQPGFAELIVAKNRNGPTESVKLTFLKDLMKFEDHSPIAEPLVEGRPF